MNKINWQFYYTYYQNTKYYSIFTCNLGGDIRYIIANYGDEILKDLSIDTYMDCEDGVVTVSKTIDATEEEINNYKIKQEQQNIVKKYYISVPCSG